MLRVTLLTSLWRLHHRLAASLACHWVCVSHSTASRAPDRFYLLLLWGEGSACEWAAGFFILFFFDHTEICLLCLSLKKKIQILRSCTPILGLNMLCGRHINPQSPREIGEDIRPFDAGSKEQHGIFFVCACRMYSEESWLIGWLFQDMHSWTAARPSTKANKCQKYTAVISVLKESQNPVCHLW